MQLGSSISFARRSRRGKIFAMSMSGLSPHAPSSCTEAGAPCIPENAFVGITAGLVQIAKNY
jgi:hypothetical protein